VDLTAEQALAGVLVTAARDGVLASAHDLADGGLALSLVETCLRRDVGVDVTLDGDPFVMLFSESTARVVVAVAAGRGADVRALCAEHGVPLTRLGTTTADPTLRVHGVFEVPLEEVRQAWEGTLPAVFGD
jgi:phosphoribosylformylglycinamidine synthase